MAWQGTSGVERPSDEAIAGLILRGALALESEGIGPVNDPGSPPALVSRNDAHVWSWAASVRPDLATVEAP